jgi:hypothetical protein
VNITCDCSVDGYDGPDVYSEEYPIARKTYICCECGEEILPGQKYEKFRGLWEGRWGTYKTCMPCVAIRERCCPHGFIFGMLRETISECLGFDYREVPEEDDDD